MDLPDWVADEMLTLHREASALILVQLFRRGTVEVGPDGEKRAMYSGGLTSLLKRAPESTKPAVAESSRYLARAELLERGLVDFRCGTCRGPVGDCEHKGRAPIISAPFVRPDTIEIRSASKFDGGGASNFDGAPDSTGEPLARAATSSPSTPSPTPPGIHHRISMVLERIGVRDPEHNLRQWGAAHAAWAIGVLNRELDAGRVADPAAYLATVARDNRRPPNAGFDDWGVMDRWLQPDPEDEPSRRPTPIEVARERRRTESMVQRPRSELEEVHRMPEPICDGGGLAPVAGTVKPGGRRGQCSECRQIVDVNPKSGAVYAHPPAKVGATIEGATV